MYSIIFQFVSTQVIERLHRRDHKVTLLIITKEGETIGQELLEYTHHGVTKFEGQGCYLKENKTMLYTVVGADEVKDVVILLESWIRMFSLILLILKGVTGNFYQEPIE